MKKIQSFIFIFLIGLRLIVFGLNTEKTDSLKNMLEKVEKEEQLEILSQLASIYQESDPTMSSEYAYQLLDISSHLKNTEYQATAYDFIGSSFYLKSELKKALENYQKSLELSIKLADTSAISNAYNNIGLVYKKLGNYNKSLAFLLLSYHLNETRKDTLSIANSLTNIGAIYYYWENNEKTLEYFSKALKLYENMGNELKVAALGNNIASVYLEQKQYSKAIDYYNKALKVYEVKGIKRGIAIIRDNIGLSYIGLEEYDKAELYVRTSLQIQKELGNQEGIIYALNNLGSIKQKKGEYQEALDYYYQTIPLSKRLNLRTNLMDSYKALYEIYYDLKNYKKAVDFYKSFIILKDSVFNENKFNQITEIETKYQTEKKEKEIELLNFENKLRDTRIKKQASINIMLVVGILALLIISFLIYNRYLIKQKANALLRKQKDEIEKQRDEIRQINRDIRSSIEYAQRIQSAVMQPLRKFESIFPESFIFNQPRDIVSGDFYWFMQKKDKIAFAVADCTGHGVPGAFMSMLGISFLNEIYTNYVGLSAAEYLKLLREKVKMSLHQTGQNREAKDGLDIAFCIFNTDKMELEFAGANNPLYVVQKGEVKVIKGDKMPIGIYLREKEEFTNHKIDIAKGTLIYLLTDGYIDQFGGRRHQKFLANNFKEMLVKIEDQNMKEQENTIRKTFLDWKGDTVQVDDILVMGVKF